MLGETIWKVTNCITKYLRQLDIFRVSSLGIKDSGSE